MIMKWILIGTIKIKIMKININLVLKTKKSKTNNKLQINNTLIIQNLKMETLFSLQPRTFCKLFQISSMKL